MAELSIEVTGAEAARFAAVPTLVFHLTVAESSGAAVHALSLRAQVRIEPQLRRYEPAEQDRLLELFGEPSRYGETLRPFLWTEVATVCGSFSGRADLELPVACSYDLEVTANRYLHSLESGVAPLIFLFSGTVFEVEGGSMAVSPVPWHLESRYRLPVELWRQVMDRYFPGSGWLRLRRDTIDAIGRFKAAEALPTWDEALTLLLKRAGAE